MVLTYVTVDSCKARIALAAVVVDLVVTFTILAGIRFTVVNVYTRPSNVIRKEHSYRLPAIILME